MPRLAYLHGVEGKLMATGMIISTYPEVVVVDERANDQGGRHPANPVILPFQVRN